MDALTFTTCVNRFTWNIATRIDRILLQKYYKEHIIKIFDDVAWISNDDIYNICCEKVLEEINEEKRYLGCRYHEGYPALGC